MSTRTYKNINLGIIGHVDAGKTSLTEKLSEVLSTASLDKNPQSKARGITLDLGFSSFQITCDDQLKTLLKQDNIQFTIVDCPGHASLFRTVIAGSSIVDIFIMVIDVVEGIQPQSSEQFILAEILKSSAPVIFVLNKIDKIIDIKNNGDQLSLLQENKRYIKIVEIIENIFIKSRMNKHEKQIIPLSAYLNYNIQSLKDSILNHIKKQQREPVVKKDVIFNVDHIFVLKGKGFALTGTLIQGKLTKNSIISPISDYTNELKIKSIQSFKKDIDIAYPGDRIGALIQGNNNEQLKDHERQIFINPSTPLISCKSLLCLLSRVPYFKLTNISDSFCYSFHIGGQSTTCKLNILDVQDDEIKVDFIEKEARSLFTKQKCKILEQNEQFENIKQLPEQEKYFKQKKIQVLKLKEWKDKDSTKLVQIILQDTIILTPDIIDSTLVVSSLAIDYQNLSTEETCRLALYGRILRTNNDETKLTQSKPKTKQTLVHRVHDSTHLIIENPFTKDVDENFIKKVQFKWMPTLKYEEDVDSLNSLVESGAIKVDNEAKVDCQYECLFGMVKKIKLQVNQQIQEDNESKDTIKEKNNEMKGSVVEMRQKKVGNYENV